MVGGIVVITLHPSLSCRVLRKREGRARPDAVPVTIADQKSRSGVEQQPDPGHNRGDDLRADDTQLPSVGL